MSPYVLHHDHPFTHRKTGETKTVRDYFVTHGGFYNEVSGDLAKAKRFATPQGAKLAAHRYGLTHMIPLRVAE